MAKSTATDITAIPSKSSAFDEEGTHLQKRSRRITKTLNIFRIIGRVIDVLSSFPPSNRCLTLESSQLV
jgi:hypothetical protein